MIKLTGKKNVCPVCGKVFSIAPPLVAYTNKEYGEEFYGGRVKFTKEVVCKCTARYKELIERKLGPDGELFEIIDMVILKPGIKLDSEGYPIIDAKLKEVKEKPKAELKDESKEEVEPKTDEETDEADEDEAEEESKDESEEESQTPRTTLKNGVTRMLRPEQRKMLRQEAVLATVVDLDSKIETLTHLTMKELKTMCKRRKVPFGLSPTKQSLARRLLLNNPELVVAPKK